MKITINISSEEDDEPTQEQLEKSNTLQALMTICSYSLQPANSVDIQRYIELWEKRALKYSSDKSIAFAYADIAFLCDHELYGCFPRYRALKMLQDQGHNCLQEYISHLMVIEISTDARIFAIATLLQMNDIDKQRNNAK